MRMKMFARKIRAVIFGVTLVGTLLLVSVAQAHHGNVAFNMEKLITMKGVVKEFQWTNPHTFVVLTADDGHGQQVEWTLEGRSPGILLRAGWTRKSILPGETVTIQFNPAKDGGHTGLVEHVTKADGSVLPGQPGE